MEPQAEKLLLFGGTFDPPHNGHVCLLTEAIKAVNPDKVLIMPTGIPPHKTANHTSAKLRMEMCKCFLPFFEKTIIDDTEISRNGKSYTMDTINILKNRYPNSKIYLSMGSDMLLMFRKWHRYEEILKAVTLVVHCRENEDAQPTQQYVNSLIQQKAEILLVKAEIKKVSSTQIRNCVKENKSISNLVLPSVEKIIMENHLYKN